MLTEEEITKALDKALDSCKGRERTIEIKLSGSPDRIVEFEATIKAKCKGIKTSVFFEHQLVKSFFDKLNWKEVK